MKKIHTGTGTILFLVACTLARGASAQTLPVSNIEELYGAVNDPANAGMTLLLSAGTYVLSANTPAGAPRPKGGRIELQRDMSLQGVADDRSLVVIDAFNLPASSFPQSANGVNTGPNAAIRLGLGYNSLEWLTVRDGRAAQANIDVGLQSLDPLAAYIRIAHIASTGSSRGLNVANFGPQTSGQTIEADIVDSQFFDNDLNLSEGVRLGNFQGARGSIVNARMSGNVSVGQKQGRLIVNNRAIDSQINVVSTGNRFYDNGAGTIIVGGLSSNNTRADGNTINFEAHGEQFTGNRGVTELDHGGLVVLGVEDISAAGGGNFNTVNISLWGTRMRDNNLADLLAVGARSLSTQTAPLSQNNHVTIEIHGDGNGNGNGKWQPVESFTDSIPAAPNFGNTVNVINAPN